MKKQLLISTLVILLAGGGLILLTGCADLNTLNQPHIAQNTETHITGNYLGSNYNGNYVWGGAMNLAWTELDKNILHEKPKLATKDEIALEMVEKLNNPVFTKNDLDEKSYYIKSGYGQKTVDTINQESKAKFPKKSFNDLQLNLNPTDIISYAYFMKEIEYKTEFEKKDVLFAGKRVKGFYAEKEPQKGNVKIVEYANDDKFIVSLQLKDESDQLLLAKGYDMSDPQAIVDKINQKNKGYLPTISDHDLFEAPNLHLDYHRDYVELINKNLANQGFEQYIIAEMYENIKFDMDQKGARVENEGVIAMKDTATLEPVEPKNFILDKPYWVIMKRTDSQNPYFILGVNNTEPMEKN